jgi:hypothetical protein
MCSSEARSKSMAFSIFCTFPINFTDQSFIEVYSHSGSQKILRFFWNGRVHDVFTRGFLFLFFFFGGVGPFAGPIGSYKLQHCGHILAYCTFSPDDI